LHEEPGQQVTEAQVVTSSLKESLVSVERSQWISTLMVGEKELTVDGPKPAELARGNMMNIIEQLHRYFMLLLFVCSGAAIGDHGRIERTPVIHAFLGVMKNTSLV